MRLVTFGPAGAEQPGVLVNGDTVVALAPYLRAVGAQSADPTLAIGLLPTVRDLVVADVTAGRAAGIPVAQVRLGPPVPRPTKIVEVGWNTRSLVRVADFTPTSTPALYAKPPNTISGPHDPILLPAETKKLDYEVELGVVIGKRCRRVPKDRALDYVAGYVVANDLTARDMQFGEFENGRFHRQNFHSKAFDTTCPIGPCLVTPDEIADPGNLRIQTFVNGEARQDGSTNELLWDIPSLIEDIARCMTLEVGDLILTGSPAGVGYYLDPPTFLAPGDVVVGEIEGVGRIENRVRADA
ncbi:MAG TPA: fumarylacetoacetate hydrolase family protein [Nocardioidaceae bacterium]|nr:fumarylacetoacetate hydrolase family protein [Nocardioidaceae bacterium]